VGLPLSFPDVVRNSRQQGVRAADYLDAEVDGRIIEQFSVDPREHGDGRFIALLDIVDRIDREIRDRWVQERLPSIARERIARKVSDRCLARRRIDRIQEVRAVANEIVTVSGPPTLKRRTPSLGLELGDVTF